MSFLMSCVPSISYPLSRRQISMAKNIKSGLPGKTKLHGKPHSKMTLTFVNVSSHNVRVFSFQQFVGELIRAKGYEIKGETFDEKSLKYISF